MWYRCILIETALHQRQPAQPSCRSATDSHWPEPAFRICDSPSDPSCSETRLVRRAASMSSPRHRQYVCILHQTASFFHVSLHARHVGCKWLNSQQPSRPKTKRGPPQQQRSQQTRIAEPFSSTYICNEHDLSKRISLAKRLKLQQRVVFGRRYRQQHDGTTAEASETGHAESRRQDHAVVAQARVWDSLWWRRRCEWSHHGVGDCCQGRREGDLAWPRPGRSQREMVRLCGMGVHLSMAFVYIRCSCR